MRKNLISILLLFTLVLVGCNNLNIEETTYVSENTTTLISSEVNKESYNNDISESVATTESIESAIKINESSLADKFSLENEKSSTKFNWTVEELTKYINDSKRLVNKSKVIWNSEEQDKLDFSHKVNNISDELYRKMLLDIFSKDLIHKNYLKIYSDIEKFEIKLTNKDIFYSVLTKPITTNRYTLPIMENRMSTDRVVNMLVETNSPISNYFNQMYYFSTLKEKEENFNTIIRIDDTDNDRFSIVTLSAEFYNNNDILYDFIQLDVESDWYVLVDTERSRITEDSATIVYKFIKDNISINARVEWQLYEDVLEYTQSDILLAASDLLPEVINRVVGSFEIEKIVNPYKNYYKEDLKKNFKAD